jgi:hypothetical protein
MLFFPPLLSSFSCVKNELLPSHPLELSEKNVSVLPVCLFLFSSTKILSAMLFLFDFTKPILVFRI